MLLKKINLIFWSFVHVNLLYSSTLLHHIQHINKPVVAGMLCAAKRSASTVFLENKFFDLGNVVMNKWQMPQGVSRENFYKEQMNMQNQYYKKTILNLLKVDDEQRNNLEKGLNQIFDNFEKTCDEQFKRDKDLEKILNTEGKEYKVFIDPNQDDNRSACTIAPKNIIFINDSIKKMHKLPLLYILNHECSHIKHKDNLFTQIFSAITKIHNSKQKKRDYINTQLFDSGSPINMQGYADCSIEIKDIDRFSFLEIDRNYKEWRTFIERRSDMESLFSLKSLEAFKEQNKGGNFYQEFPLGIGYNFHAGYSKQAPVDYINDFLNGNTNDFVRTNELNKKL